MVGQINVVATLNVSNECDSMPSYLKLIPYPNFKIFLLSSVLMSTEVYQHMQQIKMFIIE